MSYIDRTRSIFSRGSNDIGRVLGILIVKDVIKWVLDKEIIDEIEPEP